MTTHSDDLQETPDRVEPDRHFLDLIFEQLQLDRERSLEDFRETSIRMEWNRLIKDWFSERLKWQRHLDDLRKNTCRIKWNRLHGDSYIARPHWGYRPDDSQNNAYKQLRERCRDFFRRLREREAQVRAEMEKNRRLWKNDRRESAKKSKALQKIRRSRARKGWRRRY